MAACIVLWYLYVYSPSIVITTAPDQKRVRFVLWKEIAVRYKKARWPLGGELITQKLQLADNHFAIGIVAKSYDPTGFSGFHEYRLLAVLDEACGISQEIQLGIDGSLTSPVARKLSIGNPTDPSMPFADDFKPGSTASKMTISVFDTPNFSAFGIGPQELESGTWPRKLGLDMDANDERLGKALETVKWPSRDLVNPIWAYEKMLAWGGLESPMAYAKIWGKFPQDSSHALIKLGSILKAQEWMSKPHIHNKYDDLILSCDVARFGNDSTIVAKRRGPWIRIIEERQKQDTMATANMLAALVKKVKPDMVKVDDDGAGGGVVDRLKEMQREGDIPDDVKIVRIRNGSTPHDTERYCNVRDECYGRLRDAAEAGELDLDPKDEQLADELQAVKYAFVSRGRLKVEPKEDLKKRLKRSPDRADAIAYSYAEPVEEPDFWDCSPDFGF